MGVTSTVRTAALAVAGVALVAGCGSGNSLTSRQVHDNLVQKLESAHISSADAGKLADCAISKLKAQGYHNEGDVPSAVARQAGQVCAQQQLQGQGG